MDRESFTYTPKNTYIKIYLKTKKFAKLAKYVQASSDTSNYELDRMLPITKKKSNWFNEDQLDGKIMKQLASLRAKTYSYLTDNSNQDKKAKGNKRFVIKRKAKFKAY